MIHPGRRHLVRTRELLARDMGMAVGTFGNKRLYTATGFPAPISSAGARVLLWDGEQTAAYIAGELVPPLPAMGGPDILLDRQEAAAEALVTPRTWDGYKKDPRLSAQVVDVHGVEHWPRGAVQDFRDGRPGKGSAPGRPKGRANAVPRSELPARVTALLEAMPAATIADTCAALGVAPATAQRVLAQLRAERIRELMEISPSLTFDQAADRLGYPATVRRAARDLVATTDAESGA
ncbi:MULTISPECIES: hypothetical protein [unclassified Streptomyces]|uniref:hypothetical protein n=1 Tax=unclassified Streptomyces TaxID=2593676 RepID=UPI00363A7C87